MKWVQVVRPVRRECMVEKVEEITLIMLSQSHVNKIYSLSNVTRLVFGELAIYF